MFVTGRGRTDDDEGFFLLLPHLIPWYCRLFLAKLVHKIVKTFVR